MIELNSLISSQKQKKNKKRIFVASILVLILAFNFIFISSSFLHNFNESSGFPSSQADDANNYIHTQGIDPSLLQDPYTVNFTDIWSFFESNYASEFDFDINTYFRLGDENGTVLNNFLYSLDNLLLYNTLLKNASLLHDNYEDLQSTLLWYDGSDTYDYGFVDSLDGNSEEVNDYRRNLIDNLMPIFLLTETNPDDNLANINEAFELINSSQFWDPTNNVFLNYNSSTGNVYAIDNLYAVMATLLINQTNIIDDQIQIDAGKLANYTMETLTDYFWDSDNKGYNHSYSNDLTTIIDGNKYLETNALGIITLVEYWKQNTNKSVYLNNATQLFDIINSTMWNETYGEGAYLNQSASDWSNPNELIDLKTNAIMMEASLKLFEATGNVSYYDTAIKIYKTFENIFYDTDNNAYATSLNASDGSIDKNKNLLSNLRLSEAYLTALDIYQNTSVSSSFKLSEAIPEFIFDQETMNISTNYTYTSQYSNYSIAGANLTYIIKYPNGTILTTLYNITNENGTHNFSYYFPRGLLIAKNYSIIIFANKSFYEFAYTTLYFNVSSGIDYVSGLENVDEYNQGVAVNVSILVNNTRNNDLYVNFSIEADSNLIMSSRSFLLNSSQERIIWNNFSVRNDAIPANYTFHFILKNGSDIFLDYTKQIAIKSSLEVANLIYDGKVIEGDSLQISLNIENYLRNQSTSFNLTIMGDNIQTFQQEYSIDQNEIKSIQASILVDNDINEQEIQINIKISRSNTIYYNNTISTQIVNKFEITSLFCPSSTTQGSSAQFIMTINNNKETNELYAVSVNGKVSYGIMTPAGNNIAIDLDPINNPYDISPKTYDIEIFDSSGTLIFKFFFKIQVKLSVMNILLFYILPILVPIALVLYFKNKQLITERLRR
jgi:hypothetical protein